MGVRGPTPDAATDIITIRIVLSIWSFLVLSSWLATLKLGRRRRSVAAVAVALQGFFIDPLVITLAYVDCGFTFLVVNAACDSPPPSPRGLLSAMMPLPRVASHPKASRAAGVLVTGSLGYEDPMASGRASTLGSGGPPAEAAPALRIRAAGTAALDFASTPRAVGTRLPTCAHNEDLDFTCNFTASAQASSPRRRKVRRTRRSMQRAANLGPQEMEEA